MRTRAIDPVIRRQAHASGSTRVAGTHDPRSLREVT